MPRKRIIGPKQPQCFKRFNNLKENKILENRAQVIGHACMGYPTYVIAFNAMTAVMLADEYMNLIKADFASFEVKRVKSKIIQIGKEKRTIRFVSKTSKEYENLSAGRLGFFAYYSDDPKNNIRGY